MPVAGSSISTISSLLLGFGVIVACGSFNGELEDVVGRELREDMLKDVVVPTAGFVMVSYCFNRIARRSTMWHAAIVACCCYCAFECTVDLLTAPPFNSKKALGQFKYLVVAVELSVKSLVVEDSGK